MNLMTRIATLVLLFSSFIAPAFAQNHRNEAAAVKNVLNTQVDAWNRGDLVAFMEGYWHSPDLTFFANGTEAHGWDAALERYQKNYQSDGHAMGKLDFTRLDINFLAPNAAFVRGHFHLVMPDGKEPAGEFTLILRKFPDGWKIIHDHSSS